jgi:hypothetical protein
MLVVACCMLHIQPDCSDQFGITRAMFDNFVKTMIGDCYNEAAAEYIETKAEQTDSFIRSIFGSFRNDGSYDFKHFNELMNEESDTWIASRKNRQEQRAKNATAQANAEDF